MIERIVVPVDGSAASERALLVAPTLGRWAGATVELLSIVEPSEAGDAGPRLAQMADGLGTDATVRIVESGGPLVPTLLNELHRDERSLWCVGSHARSAVAEMLVGSASEDLVRQAHVPVALVGPGVVGPPAGRVLVVALDGDELAATVIEPAAALAGALGMTLRLLQVFRAGVAARADVPETAYLTQVAGGRQGATIADYDVLHSRRPGRELADHARRDGSVGMVALATHGRAPAQRLLHPSVALDVARHAPVPVLLVHPPAAS